MNEKEKLIDKRIWLLEMEEAKKDLDMINYSIEGEVTWQS